MDVATYCAQTDNHILNDIIKETVPPIVLTDKDGWKRVCQVRGRNHGQVDPTVWQRLCAARGDAGPPPGPYN